MAEQSRRFVSLDKPIDKFIEDQKKQEPAKQGKGINSTRRILSFCCAFCWSYFAFHLTI